MFMFKRYKIRSYEMGLLFRMGISGDWLRPEPAGTSIRSARSAWTSCRSVIRGWPMRSST
jgi:hypothetical protein